MKKDLIKTSKIVLLALTIGLFVGLAHGQWSGPTSQPGGSNVFAPVIATSGSSPFDATNSQHKSGVFAVDKLVAQKGFIALGGSIFGGIVTADTVAVVGDLNAVTGPTSIQNMLIASKLSLGHLAHSGIPLVRVCGLVGSLELCKCPDGVNFLPPGGVSACPVQTLQGPCVYNFTGTSAVQPFRLFNDQGLNPGCSAFTIPIGTKLHIRMWGAGGNGGGGAGGSNWGGGGGGAGGDGEFVEFDTVSKASVYNLIVGGMANVSDSRASGGWITGDDGDNGNPGEPTVFDVDNWTAKIVANGGQGGKGGCRAGGASDPNCLSGSPEAYFGLGGLSGLDGGGFRTRDNGKQARPDGCGPLGCRICPPKIFGYQPPCLSTSDPYEGNTGGYGGRGGFIGGGSSNKPHDGFSVYGEGGPGGDGGMGYKNYSGGIAMPGGASNSGNGAIEVYWYQ